MNKIKQIIKKVEEYEDNNCFELKTSVVLYWLNEIQKEAINYTHCCKSDSEQLLAVAKYVYWNYDESSSKKPEDYLKDFSSQ